METKYLLPHKLKKLGWMLFIPGVLLGVYYLIVDPNFECLNFKVPQILFKEGFVRFESNNLFDEIASILIIIGGMMVAFSCERIEDELIKKVRLESLLWATIINYFILFLCIVLLFDFTFFYVLLFNMFTILLLFILKFNYAVHTLKKDLTNEE